MLPRCSTNKRVIDCTTRDAKPRKLSGKIGGLYLTNKRRSGEVASQDAVGIGWRTTQSSGEACQDGVRFEPGVSGEPQLAASDSVDG